MHFFLNEANTLTRCLDADIRHKSNCSAKIGKTFRQSLRPCKAQHAASRPLAFVKFTFGS